MKFGHLFEFHKIPDWYTEYVHYNELKEKISEFKQYKKQGEVKQLKGYYMINKHGQLYCIDFIKDYKPADGGKSRNAKNTGAGNAYFSLSEVNTSSNHQVGSQEQSKGSQGGELRRNLSALEMERPDNDDQAPCFVQQPSSFQIASVLRTNDYTIVEEEKTSTTQSGFIVDEESKSETKEQNRLLLKSAEEQPSPVMRHSSDMGPTMKQRTSQRIITGSMRKKNQDMRKSQTNQMTTIVEEGPSPLDDDDIVEKQLLGTLLISKFEAEVDDKSEMNLSAVGSRSNTRIFNDVKDPESRQDLTQSLLSDQSGNLHMAYQTQKDELSASMKAGKKSRPQSQLISTGIDVKDNMRTGSMDDLNISSKMPFQAEKEKLESLIPELKKKDLQLMQPDVRDAYVEYSEQLTIEWIHAFLDEIYRIDDFFKNKQTELINNFIGLQDKFRIRTEKYEFGSNNTKKSKRSNQSKTQSVSQRSRQTGEHAQSLLLNNEKSTPLSPRETESARNSLRAEFAPGSLRGAEAGMSRPKPGLLKTHEAVSPSQSLAGASHLLSGKDTLQIQLNSSTQDNSLAGGQTGLIARNTRYRNLQDLQTTVGSEDLKSYIVPELKEISENMKSKKIKVAKKTDIKDEFEQMVNWKRVFEQIWQQIRWLISYGQINELALRKIMKKFAKNFFALRNNTINKKLSSEINEMSFKMEEGKMTRELQILSQDLLTFYADCFCKGNLRQAKTQLDAQYNDMRRKDSNLISFFGGGLIVLFSFFIFLTVCPEATGSDWNEIYAGMDTYYFTAVICFILYSCGFAVQIFRRYNINYTFIFEVDQHYKLIHHQLYRVALIFTFVWFLCLTWQVAMVKLAPEFNDSHVQYFSIILLVAFFAMCLAPFHIFYMKGRVQLAKTLWNIVISPCGKVRFRHFFLADVITSMVGPIQHLFNIYCYYDEKSFVNGHKVDLQSECYNAYWFSIVFGILPFWFRFAQCLNKFKETEQRVHLVNAGKYFSCIVPQFFPIWLQNTAHADGIKYQLDAVFYAYMCIYIVRTTYCFIWDIYMDWGLCRSNKKGDPHRFLRAKINYAPGFYYWAVFSDFILRYIFILFWFKIGDPESGFNKLDSMFALSVFAEGFRRAQWALLRVENEQNNNLEAYRTIPIIPPIISNLETKGSNARS